MLFLSVLILFRCFDADSLFCLAFAWRIKILNGTPHLSVSAANEDVVWLIVVESASGRNFYRAYNTTVVSHNQVQPAVLQQAKHIPVKALFSCNWLQGPINGG